MSLKYGRDAVLRTLLPPPLPEGRAELLEPCREQRPETLGSLSMAGPTEQPRCLMGGLARESSLQTLVLSVLLFKFRNLSFLGVPGGMEAVQENLCPRHPGSLPSSAPSPLAYTRLHPHTCPKTAARWPFLGPEGQVCTLGWVDPGNRPRKHAWGCLDREPQI